MKFKKKKVTRPIIFIFVRKNSKRIVNKNLKKINNKSLIEITIDQAKKISNVKEILISTDDERIKKIAKKKNCKVIDRPKKLTSDNSYEWLSWKHAIKKVYKQLGYDYIFLCLPVTCPLRKIGDVETGIKKFKKNKPDILLSTTKTKNHPAFNMIEKKNKFYDLYDPTKYFYRSQNAPSIYNIVASFYITTPKYILKSKRMLEGKIDTVIVNSISGIDIDEDYDLKIARFFSNKLNVKS